VKEEVKRLRIGGDRGEEESSFRLGEDKSLLRVLCGWILKVPTRIERRGK